MKLFTLTLRVPVDLKKDLDELARQRTLESVSNGGKPVTVSEIAREALEQYAKRKLKR